MNGIDAIEILVIVLTGLLLIAVLPAASAVVMVGTYAALTASLVGASWYLLANYAFLIDPSFPVLSSTILFMVLTFLKFMREAAQRREIRSAFSHYLAPEMVNRLADDPSQLNLGGETREMTFLFSDVHGFTAIAEEYKADPQILTRLINRVLTTLTNRIIDRRGTIDKYMGDCVMAFWNAPLSDAEHAIHACEAALDMLTALERLNVERREEAGDEADSVRPLKVGVGINTGDCVVGNMGSEQRYGYTVLGDAVNLASRLESQSRSYGVDIVIGQSTADAVTQRFALLELDLIAVKARPRRCASIPFSATQPCWPCPTICAGMRRTTPCWSPTAPGSGTRPRRGWSNARPWPPRRSATGRRPGSTCSMPSGSRSSAACRRPRTGTAFTAWQPSKRRP